MSIYGEDLMAVDSCVTERASLSNDWSGFLKPWTLR